MSRVLSHSLYMCVFLDPSRSKYFHPWCAPTATYYYGPARFQLKFINDNYHSFFCHVDVLRKMTNAVNLHFSFPFPWAQKNKITRYWIEEKNNVKSLRWEKMILICISSETKQEIIGYCLPIVSLAAEWNWKGTCEIRFRGTLKYNAEKLCVISGPLERRLLDSWMSQDRSQKIDCWLSLSSTLSLYEDK